MTTPAGARRVWRERLIETNGCGYTRTHARYARSGHHRDTIGTRSGHHPDTIRTPLQACRTNRNRNPAQKNIFQDMPSTKNRNPEEKKTFFKICRPRRTVTRQKKKIFKICHPRRTVTRQKKQIFKICHPRRTVTRHTKSHNPNKILSTRKAR